MRFHKAVGKTPYICRAFIVSITNKNEKPQGKAIFSSPFSAMTTIPAIILPAFSYIQYMLLIHGIVLKTDISWEGGDVQVLH